MRARDPYFLSLQSALMDAGIGEPVLVIDLARLRANALHLTRGLPPGMALRLVAKSLPCPQLLSELMALTGTKRLMTFSAAMVEQLAGLFPQADQLLGKPLATRAVAGALDRLGPQAGQAVIWLADTTDRLRQLGELASARDITLRVALEIDVGLHRGGFADGTSLCEGLQVLRDTPRLQFAGLMGYEPHLAKIPVDAGWQERAIAASRAAYLAASAAVAEVLGPVPFLRNAGGSPSYWLQRDTSMADEVSVGSALVKPTDFDLPGLEGFQPAAFIATPALKVFDVLRLPGMEQRIADGPAAAPLAQPALFIHGGYWMARAVDPPDLAPHPIFGRSSNQELLTGPDLCGIAPDEFVFLRPTQSEAVLLQFGALVVVDGSRVVVRWPTLPVSA